MKLRHIFVMLVVSIWLSAMGCAMSQALYSPSLLRATETIVCPAGTEMDVQTPRYSYHRPGEYSIDISCVGPDVDQDVTLQAELVYWGFWFLPSLPLAALGTVLVTRWWQSRRARMIGQLGSWVGTMQEAPTIIVDGKQLDSVEDLPPGSQEAYEKAMQVFVDEDQDGTPDIIEGLLQGGAQVIDLKQAGTGSHVQRLHELKQMLDGGLITQAEYEEKKAEILDDM
jgi:hypothetical protein